MHNKMMMDGVERRVVCNVHPEVSLSYELEPGMLQVDPCPKCFEAVPPEKRPVKQAAKPVVKKHGR